MASRENEDRIESLITLARNNPHLATRLLSELPAEERSTLVAALARPPRKAAPRGNEVRANDNHDRQTSDAQTAYSAQLAAFARSVSRVR